MCIFCLASLDNSTLTFIHLGYHATSLWRLCSRHGSTLSLMSCRYMAIWTCSMAGMKSSEHHDGGRAAGHCRFGLIHVSYLCFVLSSIVKDHFHGAVSLQVHWCSLPFQGPPFKLLPQLLSPTPLATETEDDLWSLLLVYRLVRATMFLVHVGSCVIWSWSLLWCLFWVFWGDDYLLNGPC